ncbi:Rhomboid family protein [Aquisphaera giovannonii]|uniref:Rhomboid family protein n=1 Tax=Aquisphaera giovannonii TaxID=406548 RepID=A0A5B9W0E3_9BACT|nr:rhomboid family intramembrane serine protease [Aquisphaera giovannonii]QEH34102.1 Rhomboid family protein [Aquisphaera giovannonii]
MAEPPNTIRDEIRGVLAFVGTIWAVYLLSWIVPGIDRFGIIPRHAIGLVGIPAMPFLHGSLAHLVGNTIPLIVLLVLLAGSRAESWEVVAAIVFLSGLLLWVFGRSSYDGHAAVHIGASGLVSGLAVFLIVAGLLEQRIIPLLIAVLVAFLYGGTLIWGLLPRLGSSVSWDGHLCGAVAGGLVAYALIRDTDGRRATLAKARAADELS